MCIPTGCAIRQFESGTEDRTGVCPFPTMELALEAMSNDGSELIDIDYVDIDELNISTGSWQVVPP
jgi:hypothetical protein